MWSKYATNKLEVVLDQVPLPADPSHCACSGTESVDWNYMELLCKDGCSPGQGVNYQVF